MHGDHHYFPEVKVVVTAYWGEVSLLDILDTISARIQDPALAEAQVSVIDTTLATWAEVAPEALHHEVQRLRPAFAPPKRRTILIAPSDFFYGFARMYAIVQVVYGAAKVDVVRSWEDATALLGVDLGEVEGWARRRALEEMGEATTRTLRLP